MFKVVRRIVVLILWGTGKPRKTRPAKKVNVLSNIPRRRAGAKLKKYPYKWWV